ncbi:uncharacterized protein At2g33490-like isoform X1 [Chenopodium quinoa]|uniref:uncharacterized protein At2g33490-like isoform X1 n=1 Tax=Chenopodium quinoa TaxID=63459 RepID=UPI000B78A19A|nr:uncharacterized protein At2g33490-like isoform X1 [Chenopodium quinoa]
MKSSLGKLKRFAFQRNDGKDRKEFHPPPLKLDHLALASEEMQDMRNCYDSLLSAAAATANSAYEFSESLREMGGCLQEKADLYKDDESKRVFMMLGKVQFELQKLVDHYRSHIFLTITKPSESLLDELQTVQEMKQQCDEKRSVYEYMIAQHKEKGRSKSGKGEGFSVEQLQQAHTEYEEEATLCVFRLKSLKQGQSRSLLTQAARHHTSQLNFFRKGLKSLEAADPLVKLITEKQHIDYQLSGLDEGLDGEDEGENSYDSNDNGELSFDYRPHKMGTEAAATSRNSMELDQEDQLFPKASTVDSIEFSLEKVHGDSQMLESEPMASSYSHSAPIIPEKKFDPAERARQMRPSRTQKFHAYVLPTPSDAKSSNSSRTSSAPRTRPTTTTHNMWHSSPLETKINKRDSKEDNQTLSFFKAHTLNDERDTSHENQASTLLPPSVADGLSFQQRDSVDTSDHKKLKRQSFSGPLSSNSRSGKPGFSASGPIPASKLPPLRASGPMLPQPSSPKTSSRHSPPSVSPPKISELHELPRPPGIVSNKPTTSSASSGLSGPLGSKNSEFSVENKSIFAASNTASPLPTPPLTVPRSFSIPSSHYRTKANVTKLLESPQLNEKDIASPPLTPMSLANANAVLTSPRAGTQSSGT